MKTKATSSSCNKIQEDEEEIGNSGVHLTIRQQIPKALTEVIKSPMVQMEPASISSLAIREVIGSSQLLTDGTDKTTYVENEMEVTHPTTGSP